jgi:hypothetical protein
VCLNGGTCSAATNYLCDCVGQFFGNRCENRVTTKSDSDSGAIIGTRRHLAQPSASRRLPLPTAYLTSDVIVCVCVCVCVWCVCVCVRVREQEPWCS